MRCEIARRRIPTEPNPIDRGLEHRRRLAFRNEIKPLFTSNHNHNHHVRRESLDPCEGGTFGLKAFVCSTTNRMISGPRRPSVRHAISP